jgi:hypothetical protein
MSPAKKNGNSLSQVRAVRATIISSVVLVLCICVGGRGYAQTDATPPVPATDRPMIFGVLETGVSNDMCSRMVRAGMNNIRFGICWWDIEKKRGTYNWEKTDRAIDTLHQYGIKIVACVATAPEWAIDASPEVKRLLAKAGFPSVYGTAPWSAEFWPDYERYLREMVQRYGERVDHWELWNEPDGLSGIRLLRNRQGRVVDLRFGGDAEWYCELLRRSYPIFKEVDPGSLVCAGAFESKNGYQIELLNAMYDEGCAPFFDAISVHSYGNPLKFEWISKVRQAMVEHGDSHKPIWMTEWGMKGPFLTKKARVINALRYFRETPWITVGNVHTYGHAANPPELLDVWREMVEERGPRDRYETSFEQDDILECWGRGAEVEYREGDAHSGQRAAYGRHEGDQPPELRVSLYTRALHPTLSFWCKVRTQDPATKVSMRIEVFPAEFTAGSLSADLMEYGVPHDTWFRMEVPFFEHFPRFDGNIIVFVSIQPLADAPGVEFLVDDVVFEGVPNPLFQKTAG